MKSWLKNIALLLFLVPAVVNGQTVRTGQTPKNILAGPSTFIDDIELRFGTGGTMACEWSTTDANANEFVCSGPEGGATDVPVFVFGDATCNALDIGLFNGLTNGTIAAMNDACTGGTYFSHNGTDGTMNTSTGDLLLNIAGANLAPSANDGAALGISGTAWSDLFGATGFVLDLGAGDVTATHSANTLAFAGASSGYTFDSFITVVTTDPADAGEIRLNNAATIGWEAAPAGTDETLTLSSDENFQLSGPLELDASDPADAGALRLDNAENIAWEASPAGTDVTLTVSASEMFQFSDPVELGSAGVRMSGDGDGAITFLGLGDGTDEDLTLNLDDTSDTVTATSSTGVTLVNFSGIDVTSTACSSIEAVEYNPTEAGATDDYINLMLTGLTSSAFSATETDQDMFMVPRAMVARDLRAEVSTAPGVGNDAWVITLRDDAASTTLTCTIDETATNCSDTSNAPSIVAGSKLDLLVASSGPGADPDTAATMNISFCLGQ